MKKIISLSLALMLVLGILIVPASAEETTLCKIGVLSMLNIDESKMKDILTARTLLIKAGFAQNDNAEAANTENHKNMVMEPIYYDSLNAMLMALDAGDIDRMEIYESTAKYLCATNDKLFYISNDGIDTSTDIGMALLKGILANDFAFMMTEGREAMRDEFNTAVATIKEDGTMEKLIAEYIDGAIEGKDIAPIEIAKIDGAETIKIAITGSLPPMDYIAPDGTPAGFNTALLAEISKRIGKNIELVQVDSIGRAAALASGSVDVVFWTRTSSFANRISSKSEDEKKAFDEERDAKVLQVKEIFSPEMYSTADMPEKTIITDPFFTDTLVIVMIKT